MDHLRFLISIDNPISLSIVVVQFQVEPVINGGRIVDIVITNPGNGYICPPNLVITGPGRFARLTPIITNGRLTEVKIINSGAEYVPGQTQIEVQGPGNNYCRI